MIKALKQTLCLHFWGLSLYTVILGQFIRSIDIYAKGVKKLPKVQ